MPRPSGRSIAEHLAEYLTSRPKFVVLLAPAAAAFVDFLQFCGAATKAIAQRIAELPASIGYEPLLLERKVSPLLARALARLAIRRGTRVAKESERRRAVVAAIRFLAKPRRSCAGTLRKAKVLLAAWEETSIVETIFSDAGLSESEFIRLLKAVVDGGEAPSARIAEIAAAIAPRLVYPRGPRISAASAAHQFLLEKAHSVTGVRGYSWNPVKAKFSDPLTQATRQEFHLADFDPRPAVRRSRRKTAEARRQAPSA